MHVLTHGERPDGGPAADAAFDQSIAFLQCDTEALVTFGLIGDRVDRGR